MAVFAQPPKLAATIFGFYAQPDVE